MNLNTENLYVPLEYCTTRQKDYAKGQVQNTDRESPIPIESRLTADLIQQNDTDRGLMSKIPSSSRNRNPRKLTQASQVTTNFLSPRPYGSSTADLSSTFITDDKSLTLRRNNFSDSQIFTIAGEQQKEYFEFRGENQKNSILQNVNANHNFQAAENRRNALTDEQNFGCLNLLKSASEKPRPYTLTSKLVAEFMGTISLVFISSLSSLGSSAENGRLHAALATGLTIFVMACTLGYISGGHFNPAISFAVALTGKLSVWHLIPYWLSQLTASLAGAFLVKSVTQVEQYNQIIGGATIIPENQFWYQGLLVEIFLTSILTQTILNVAVDTSDNHLAPLAIGCTIVLDILGGGSISGASMNPARSFGPCILATFYSSKSETLIWQMHYIYWLGPFIGAIISTIIFNLFFTRGSNRIF